MLENESSAKGLTAAHGLSVWVRQGDTRLLFDTGPDDGVLKNAAALGVDLKTLSALVLSHNHWDHTGGCIPLLDRLDRSVPVYTGEGFFRERYARDGDELTRLSALDREELLARGAALHEVGAEPVDLGDGLYLVSGWDTEPADPPFVVEGDGGWEADCFRDEIALVYEGQQEITLLCGCAHPGIVGMAKRAAELFHKPVYTLLGGAHLTDADEDRVKQIAETLSDQGVKLLGLSHCSGDRIHTVWEKKKYGFSAGFHGGDLVVVEIV